jgi:hypothetical protein
MYCQFCGQQLTAGMNYCKQCGAAAAAQAPLSKTPAFSKTPQPASSAGGIVWAIVGGLAVIFGTSIPLFALVNNPLIVLAAMAMGIICLGMGVGAMIRHLQKMTALSMEAQDRGVPRLGPVPPRYLDPGATGMPSVTETTTRSLDRSTETPAHD